MAAGDAGGEVEVRGAREIRSDRSRPGSVMQENKVASSGLHITSDNGAGVVHLRCLLKVPPEPGRQYLPRLGRTIGRQKE